VEHPVLVVKRQFGYMKVRYRGLNKNTAQLFMLFALSNLWMVRSKLTGVGALVRPKTGAAPCKGKKSPSWQQKRACFRVPT
jgi:hypothetical protein